MFGLLSYAEATKKLSRVEKIEYVLKLVEPYLRHIEKAVLCRVRQSLHQHYNPLLWIDPCAIILRRRLPYHALLSFLQLMIRIPVQAHTRRLCTTFDLRLLAGTVLSEGLQTAFLTLARDDRLLGLEDRGVSRLPLGSFSDALSILLPESKYLILDGLPPLKTDRALPNNSNQRLVRTREDYAAFCPTKPATEDGSGSTSLVMETNSDSSSDAASRNGLLALSLSNMPWIIPSSLLCHQSLAKIMYLDLSRSLNPRVQLRKELSRELQSLSHLRHLKILKLRDIGMTDADFMLILHEHVGRLISLDVRNNKLTDESLNFLCGTLETNKVVMTDIAEQECFFLAEPPAYKESNDHDQEQDVLSLPSIGMHPDGIDTVIGMLQSDDLSFGPGSAEGSVHYTIARMVGLTHLHLANNSLSDTGLLNLQGHSDGLHYLDWGSMTLTKRYSHRDEKNLRIYGAEGWSISDRLISIRQLRIHNSLITGVATVRPIGEYRLSERNLVRLVEEDFYLHRDRSGQFSLRNQPHLHTLVLTDVPRQTYAIVVDALKSLLVEAGAQERKIARAAAAYSRSLRGPKMVTGLRVLRLEFAATSDTSRSDARAGPSVSGDADADLFSAESEGDFSFFAEERSGLQVEGQQDMQRRGKPNERRVYDNDQRELLDVYMELKKFRTDLKGRDGAWTGRIEVIM